MNKISADSRKNNLVSFVSTQNASSVLGAKSLSNFAGALFVGRTADEQAQRDALTLLGKPEGAGYEAILGNLSRRRRSGEELGYREFIYRDGSVITWTACSRRSRTGSPRSARCVQGR